MSLFDVILIAIIGGFALFGFWFGLVTTLGSLIGTVFGVFLASRWYMGPAMWLSHTTGWNENFCKVTLFIILFFVINRIIGFVFYLLDRTFSFITRLPFVNSLNRVLGAVFGVFEGIVTIGILFYFVSRFPLGPNFMAAVNASQVVPFCGHVASVLWPLVPEAIRVLTNTLQNIIN